MQNSSKNYHGHEPIVSAFLQQIGKTDAVVTSTWASTAGFSIHQKEDRISGQDF
jgi:hypothetical protein